MCCVQNVKTIGQVVSEIYSANEKCIQADADADRIETTRLPRRYGGDIIIIMFLIFDME